MSSTVSDVIIALCGTLTLFAVTYFSRVSQSQYMIFLICIWTGTGTGTGTGRSMGNGSASIGIPKLCVLDHCRQFLILSFQVHHFLLLLILEVTCLSWRAFRGKTALSDWTGTISCKAQAYFLRP